MSNIPEIRNGGLSIVLAAVLGPMGGGVVNGQVAEKADDAAEQPIATVLDKPVYLKDVKLDENDKTELRDYFAIAEPVVVPLYAKYIAGHKLAATPGEIKEFRAATFAQPESEPADSHVKDPARKSLAEDIRKAQEPGTEEGDALDELAKMFVEKWKFNKALYEKYGGRVIFQQAGIEPLDAYQDWLKDEEKAGNFQLHDPKWKDAFWKYYDPKFHHFIDVPDPFKVPLSKTAKDAGIEAADEDEN